MKKFAPETLGSEVSRQILLILISLILLVQYSYAQSESTTGNIEGRIIDQRGAAVPGILITATNQDNGFVRPTRSGTDGSYILVLLPLGNYRIETAAEQGFAASVFENLKVTLGAKIARDFKLQPIGPVNDVVVASRSDGLEDTQTSVSTTLDEREVSLVPTLRRNFLDIAVTTPGVTRDPGRGGVYSVGGLKGELSSLQVDGANSDNTFYGQMAGRIGTRASIQYSVDAVKEVQLNQFNYSAEFGRAAGAVMNVVTKSGANRFNGGGFWLLENSSLNANSPNVKQNQAVQGLPNKREPGGRNTLGVSIGGPIRKDKMFFFAAYEGLWLDGMNHVVLNSLTTSAPPAVQDFLQPKTVPYPTGGNNNALLAKVDMNVSDKDQVWVRFNHQILNGINNESSGINVAGEHSGNRNDLTSTLVANWTSAFTPNWFNEFRFQYSLDKSNGFANTTDPEVVLTDTGDTFLFGQNSTSPNETTISRYQFINNQTFLTGKHRLKYGADLLFDKMFNFAPSLFSGSYSFSSYDALNNQILRPAGQFASRYRQSFAGTGTSGPTTYPDSNDVGVFLQDDWRATPKLTLNLGLRYDYQAIARSSIRNPDPALLSAGFDTSLVPADKNNFAPRIGISYAFDKRSVVRGGYGLFFGRTPGMMTSSTYAQNGIQIVSIDISCGAPPGLCPVYPTVFSSVPANVVAMRPTLYVFANDYRQPFTHQANLQLEREISQDFVFKISYLLVRGDGLTRARDANLSPPIPTVVQVYDQQGLPTGENFTFQKFSSQRPLQSYGRINVYESSAKSLYRGVTLELNRRFANRWQFNASYTFSRADDDKPDQSAILSDGGARVAENPFDLKSEYGRSDLDVGHRFIFSPVVETGRISIGNQVVRALLSNYVVSAVLRAESGAVYSALVSGDPNRDNNGATDRLPGTLRNEFTARARYTVDLRLGRVLHFGERSQLTLWANGFNILNRSNVLAPNNTPYKYETAGSGLPERLTANTAIFGSPRTFLAAGQASNAQTSSYNREIQLGVRYEF